MVLNELYYFKTFWNDKPVSEEKNIITMAT